MTRLDITLEILKPTLRSVAGILRRKDANSTGKDDMAADIFEYAMDAADAIQDGTPLPDLPASLRPKEKVDTAPLE